MEIDDDDETPRKNDSCMLCCLNHVRYLFHTPCSLRIAAAPSSVPTQVQQPSIRLLCTNLPQEVTDDVLSVLFQQYDVSQIFPLQSINHFYQVQGFPEGPCNLVTCSQFGWYSSKNGTGVIWDSWIGHYCQRCVRWLHVEKRLANVCGLHLIKHVILDAFLLWAEISYETGQTWLYIRILCPHTLYDDVKAFTNGTFHDLLDCFEDSFSSASSRGWVLSGDETTVDNNLWLW